MDETAEKASEKEEFTARRPDEWRGPTKGNFLVFVLDVNDIDGANQEFYRKCLSSPALEGRAPCESLQFNTPDPP